MKPDIIAYAITGIASINLFAYLGYFGDPFVVTHYGSGEEVIRSYGAFEVIRMGSVLGISPGGHGLIYSIAFIYFLLHSRAPVHLLLAGILGIAIFLNASNTSFIFITLMLAIRAAKLAPKKLRTIAAVFMLILVAYSLLSFEGLIGVSIGEYFSEILHDRVELIARTLIIGGNFDFPSSLGFRGVRDLGILSFMSQYGILANLIFAFVIVISISRNARWLSRRRVPTFGFFLAISVFLHGVFFHYPSLSLSLILTMYRS